MKLSLLVLWQAEYFDNVPKNTIVMMRPVLGLIACELETGCTVGCVTCAASEEWCGRTSVTGVVFVDEPGAAARRCMLSKDCALSSSTMASLACEEDDRVSSVRRLRFQLARILPIC